MSFSCSGSASSWPKRKKHDERKHGKHGGKESNGSSASVYLVCPSIAGKDPGCGLPSRCLCPVHPIPPLPPTPAPCKEQILVLDSFAQGLPIVPAPATPSVAMIPPVGTPPVYNLPFYYFTVPGVIVGDDGVITTPPGGGLSVSSQPFGQTVPSLPVAGASLAGTLDHVKFLVFSENSYPIDPTGVRETYFETSMSAFTLNTENHPFDSAVTDPNDDLRLGASALVTNDFSTLMVADIFFTNAGIYALYDRLENLRTPTNNYASFTNAIRIGSRNRADPASDAATVGIGWTRSAIRYYINRQEVWRIDRIGFKPANNLQTVIVDRGGDEQLVVPASVSVGFGNFTLLDGFKPNNYAGTSNQPLAFLSSAPDLYYNPFSINSTTGQEDPLLAASFADPADLPTSRIFQSAGSSPGALSQGATFNAKYLMVSSRLVPV